jgi:hypothetical protein
MSVLRVKASNNEEFDEAISGGCVYGKVVTTRPIYFVYVDLGKQGKYQRTTKDDEQTDYKIFYNCKVYSALSEEDLEAGICVGSPPDMTVIVCGNSQK